MEHSSKRICFNFHIYFASKGTTRYSHSLSLRGFYIIHLFIYYLSAFCVPGLGAIIYAPIEGLASGIFLCALKMLSLYFLKNILRMKIKIFFLQ